MKKVFLTLAMLLFAFVGVTRASVEVEVGTAQTTNSYIPTYTYYDYSITQQIYTAAEINFAGPISAITFEVASGAQTRNLNVFMKHVSYSTFSSTSDWEALDPMDALFSGTVSFAAGFVTITLDTPFDYNGYDNLLLCVQDATGSWASSISCSAYTSTGATLRAYRDGTPYDVTNLSDGAVINYKNYMKLTFNVTGPVNIVSDPAAPDLGPRPNGYWMAPYVVTLTNTGGDATATMLESNNNFFTFNNEVPFALNNDEPVEIEISTTTTTAGPVSADMLVTFTENRGFVTIPIVAEAYDAVEPDVFELATEVTTFPYTTTTTTANLYANYHIPGIDFTAHKDAVYKVTFDEDVLFSAGTNGASGRTYMYNEDFNGEEGPGADNYYSYSGPEVQPGPIDMWFSYNYAGTNTWYGTSAGGGMIFGYEIPAATLQELGLANCSLVTVEAAARDASGVAYPYDLYVLRGGTSPANASLVYYEEMGYNPTPGYFFDVDLDTPLLAGDQEPLWVMFYTESPYAAYCGRTPDNTDGKIWYTLDGSSWNSNSSYTPVIYCRFLELPSGREVMMNLADKAIKEFNGYGQLADANGEVKGISRAQRLTELQAQYNRGNRAIDELLNEGFEGGSMPTGWSTEGSYSWTIGSGTGNYNYTGSANGSYNACCYIASYSGESYLITPVLNLSNASSATLNFNYRNVSWTGDLNALSVLYRVNGGAWNTIVDADATEYASWTAYPTITLPGLAANYEIAFYCESNYGYGMGIDDVVVSADIATGGTDPMYQIADMYVPAGTYYVVTASTDTDFRFDMKTEACPDPEQPVVLDPYNTQTGVDNPYLLKWHLGNYTKEMKVLLGTQWPPEDVLIDWTDELVESIFLVNLQHNKTYFAQVIARNDNGNEIASEIVGFTTVIDPVEGFTVANDKLHPGDAAEFSWDASVRTLKGYNLYQDGVKINDTPITETEYSVDGLAYNVTTGYTFNVTAVYDEGESVYSEPIVVYMAGMGTVEGTVYEQDGTTIIAGATVSVRGADEYGLNNEFTTTTADDGTYSVDVYVGTYYAYASKDGYQECAHDGVVTVDFELVTPDIDIIVYEYYFPLGQVVATEQVEENNVLVEWDWSPAELMVDFETGDFSQADFTLPATYPWEVTTISPHDGTYCMKSTCEGITNGNSSIECTVEVPYDGLMGFYVSTSSETNYDQFHFYIDGTEMGSAISGATNYAYKEFSVSEGVHTYKWEYQKDGSVNSNSDCVYVDDIVLYKQPEPIPGGGVLYDFENSSMMGWTTIDADGDGYTWNLGSVVMSTGYGHNASTDMVLSQSYYSGVVLYPDNYFVSPSKIAAQDGAYISFWACAQDGAYPSEHFGVAVSTASNTNASDFTTIQEWTMTSKGGAVTADESRGTRGTHAQGNWYQYNVDLSSYAGQEIWVAIRHFNCSDWFYLNVDDVMLADGSAKRVANNNRSLANYKLYRRNINLPEPWVAEEIAAPAADVYSYIDNDWANLPYGVYQWGIQACYAGNAPTDRAANEQATFGFEGGLEGWTVLTVNTGEGEWLHSDNNPGGYDYTTHAHGGTGFAMCYSYVDYVGAYNTDSYLISPQKYSIGAGSSVTFWADNANDSYPENISVCVATTATPTASDFTAVWTGGAKGTGKNAEVRHKNDRYDNWRYHTVDLSAYAGQEVWIAFHDVNYDAYEIWIDDVTINYEGAIVPPTPSTGDGLSEIIWSNTLEKDMYSTVTVNVTLNNGQEATGAVVTMDGPEESYNHTMDETGSFVFEEVRKGEYLVNVALDGFVDFLDNIMIDEDETTINVMLYEDIAPVTNLYVSPTGWAMWDGPMPGGSGNGGGGGATTGDEFTEGFEGGSIPSGWISIDADGDGNDWRMLSEASLPAHTGTDGMFSQSYINNVGALNPDNFLVTNQVNIGSSSVFSFWACAQDASYPSEHFGVAISTTGTNASDFTMLQEWTMTAKEGQGPKGPRGTNDQGNWYQYTVNLGDYAGQQAYLAIRHFNCTDWFYLDIDDVALANTVTKGDRAPILYKVMLDGVYAGETKYAYFQHDVEGLVEGNSYTTSVMPIYATGQGAWEDYTWAYDACSHYTGATNVTAAQAGINVNVNFTLPDGTGGGGGGGGGGTPGAGEWYYYDNGVNESAIGTNGGNFWWGVMFPAGSYTGSLVTKVAAFDYLAMTGTVTIYNDGATAPSTAVGDMNVTFTGVNDFVEFEFPTPVAVDPSKNVWVVFYNGSGTTYPAATCANTGDANGRWVSLDGTTWEDITTYGLDYTFMVRAYIAESTKNEAVVEIVDPIHPLSNPATTLMAAPEGIRAQWDVLKTFNATSGYQYGVATDGEYIYTSSWSSSSSSMFYKYDLEGNFIEEFNISGCGQIRDLTYDGQYFYGVANSSTVYCIDLANHTLISSFTTSYGAMRCCSYDPTNDGFWVVGNWSGNLTLIDRSGNVQFTGPAPSSASGVAYYKDDDNVEHVFYCDNGTNEIYDYNVTTGTMSTSAVYNLNNVSGWTGSTGGCHVGVYNGKTCFFADAQQTPQLIAILELSESATPPAPPVSGDVLGAMIFRDGELISGTPVTTSPFVDADAPAGEHEYCVRVVYSDWSMSCPVCADADYECVPVSNLQGEYVYNDEYDFGANLTWECELAEFVVEYDIYLSDTIAMRVTDGSMEAFLNIAQHVGTYTFGVVAVYPNCESEMVTVDVTVTDVDEANINARIYPNPTNDNVTIEAKAMNHITVVNTLGQVVYDADINADMTQLNLGQFNAGVYMIRISTESGDSVKRVTVVK